MRYLLLTLFLFSNLGYASFANNLQITNVAYNEATKILTFDIAWDNSWHINDDFHDAVWVFARYKSSNSQNWNPIVFDAGNGNPATFSGTDLLFQPKGIGVIVKSAVTGFNQRDISITSVTVSNVTIDGINPSIKVFGTEMVYVPEGRFDLGDASGVEGAFSTGQSEAFPLQVNATTSEVFTRINANTETIPLYQDYPTGYKAFYCMKYEITQGQMVDFLNNLSAKQLYEIRPKPIVNDFKYLFSGNQVADRNGVAFIENNSTDGPDGFPSVFGLDLNENGVFDEEGDGASIPCVISSQYLFGFLDWAGLRPMSEMEYEKACRGTEPALRREFAWGVAGANTLAENEVANPGTPQEVSNGGYHNLGTNFGPMRVGFASTSNSDRTTSGNSFYGIANLSDNLKERVIEVTNEAFSYRVHGDGRSDLNTRDELGAVVAWVIAPIISRGGGFKTPIESGTVSDRNLSNLGEVVPILGDLGGRGVLSFD